MRSLDLVVLSWPEPVAGEASLVRNLIAAGCHRFHLRRPGASTSELARVLDALDEPSLARLVVHGHSELLDRYPLAGLHLRDEESMPAGLDPSRASRSLHRLADLASEEPLAYTFLSPIFDSLSKPGHAAGFTGEALATALAVNRARRPAGSRAILALGGITPARVPACRAWGFDGVAVLGGIWLAGDPVAALTDYVRACATGDPSALSSAKGRP